MLEQKFSQLNIKHFEGKLPAPLLAWNSRLRSTAGRFTPGSRNQLRSQMAKIEVASYLKTIKEAESHVQETILHEMIHYWLWWSKKPYGHTNEFRRIMKATGARRYNPVPVERAVKYWYECSNCKNKVPAKRKLGNVACAACCKEYYGGQYSTKFRLLLLEQNFAQTNSAAPIVETTMNYSEVIRKLQNLKQIVLQAKR